MSERSRSSAALLSDGRPPLPHVDEPRELRPDDAGVQEQRETPFRLRGLPSGAVHRTERLPKLAEIDAAVVLLNAPAGYGKTTLIEEWAELDRRPFVYVALTEGEYRSHTLAATVAGALATLKPTDHRQLRLARDHDISALLVSALERPRAAFVLVLDDAHQLSSADSDVVAHTLAEHMPRGSQLVFGRAAEISVTPRAAASESQAFRTRRGSPRAARQRERHTAPKLRSRVLREEITALTERTEGWPVGLYLATLSLR